jgi:uncharacterized protein YtpQ (UPF0354 family)
MAAMSAKWLKRILGQPKAKADDRRSREDWQLELAKPGLTKEEFCKLCDQALREQFGPASVKQLDSLDEFQITLTSGEPFTAYVENIWRQCRNNKDVRVEQVERFLRVIAGSGKGSSKLPEITSIVPTIKDETYINLSRKSVNEEPGFVHEHLVADLWIVYAIDSADAILTLPTTQFVELKLSLAELKQLAIENLKRMLPPIERHGEGPVYTLTAGSDYVASLLLFEDLWDEQANVVEGEIVAVVPSRGTLLFTGSKSSQAIIQLRQSVQQFTQTSGYLITNTMLRRSPDGWRVFS